MEYSPGFEHRIILSEHTSNRTFSVLFVKKNLVLIPLSPHYTVIREYKGKQSIHGTNTKQLFKSLT